MRHTKYISLGTAVAAALLLAGCGDTAEASDPGTTDNTADVFPVTIEHAFGSTTIEAKPERVAAVGWSNHEVALALGVVPVGMTETVWGDDDGDGVYPWVEEKLEELDAETPALFDETEGIDFEAVADTAPDVILAAYSGLTKEDYETLSKIAPVVAYPELPWGTSMDDMIKLNSQALGLAEEGEQLIADLDARVAEASAEHPELEGKVAMITHTDVSDLSQVHFYTTNDMRVGFLEDLGLTLAPVVVEASAKSDEFYVSTSAEENDKFADVDVYLTYGDAKTLSTMQADKLMAQIPAIKNGAVVMLEDSTPLAAAATPSPLSIDWGIDAYLGLILDAVAKAG